MTRLRLGLAALVHPLVCCVVLPLAHVVGVWLLALPVVVAPSAIVLLVRQPKIPHRVGLWITLVSPIVIGVVMELITAQRMRSDPELMCCFPPALAGCLLVAG